MKKFTLLLSCSLLYLSLFGQLMPEYTFVTPPGEYATTIKRTVLKYHGIVYYQDYKFYDKEFNLVKTMVLNFYYTSLHHFSDSLFIDDPSIEAIVSTDYFPHTDRDLIGEPDKRYLDLHEGYYIDLTPGLQRRLFVQKYSQTFLVYNLPGLEKVAELEEKLQGMSGGKYYARSGNNIYNADLSFYKKMKPPSYGWSRVSEFSIDQINDDTLVEVTFIRYSDLYRSTRVGIVNENGEVLLEVLDYEDLRLDIQKGLPNKLFVLDKELNKTQIYSLPGLQLEHTYHESGLIRMALSNGEGIYYVIDQEAFEVRFYNADHSLRNTVVFDKSKYSKAELKYCSISHISQTMIDPDELFEFVLNFGYLDDDIPGDHYIVNECGAALFAFPPGASVQFSHIEGYTDKIIAHYYGKRPIGGITLDSVQIYNLPFSFTSDILAPLTLEYKVFPNPFTDHINIKTTHAYETLKIKMYDLMGRVVHENSFYECTSYELEQLGHLAPGVYVMEVEQADVKSLQKVVKH